MFLFPFLYLFWFEGLPLYTEVNERLKKETDHSRLVCGRFNRQGNLNTRLVLRGCKTRRFLHRPARFIYICRYRSLNMNYQSHAVHMISTARCTLKIVPDNVFHCGMADRMHIPRTREGDEDTWIARV